MQFYSKRINLVNLRYLFSIMFFVYVVLLSGQSETKVKHSNLTVVRELIATSKPDSAIKILQSGKIEPLGQYYLLLASAYQAKGIIDSTKYAIFKAKNAHPEIQKNSYHLGEISFIQGWIHYKSLQLDSARFYNQQALKICNSIGFDSLKVLVLKNLGNLNLASGHLYEADHFYNEALQIENLKSKPSIPLIAGLIQNRGIIFASTGAIDSARIYFARSLELKETISTIDAYSLANGYTNFSNFLRSSGDLQEALNYINKAEQLLLNKNDQDFQRLAPIYLNKGSVLILLNNYEEALTYHELAINAYAQFLESDNKTFVSLNYNIGNIHEALGNYSKAVEYHLDIIDKELEPVQLVKTLRSLGSCYSNLDEDEKAEVYFLRAVKSAEDFLGINHEQTALSYLRIGYFYNNLKAYDNAIDYYLKALEVYTSIYGDKNRDVSNVLIHIGIYYFETGNYEKSLTYYQKSLNAFFDHYNDTDFYNNPELDNSNLDFNVFSILYGKAFSFYGLYENKSGNKMDLLACLNIVETAIDYYEYFKTTLDAENSKLVLATRVNNIYNLAVKAAAELYSLTNDQEYFDQAFSYSEKSKSQILLSSIREADAIKEGMIPPNLKSTEEKIRDQIISLNNMIYEEKQNQKQDSIKISDLQRELYNQKIRYDSLITSLEVNYPDYYNLKYNYKVISFNEVKKQLTEQQVFIEYKLADSLLFAFVLTTDTFALIKTRIDTTFTTRVEELINAMKILPVSSDPALSSYNYAVLSNGIFQTLFPGNFYDGKDLIIIPDDIIGYLSFDALVTTLPDKAKSNFRKLAYLIYNHTIYYGYSATLLMNKTKPKHTRKTLLAMAPNYKKSGGADTIIANVRTVDKLLRPLFHTKEEVAQINETYKGKLLVGDNATEDTFKSRASKYKILHFAMHTLVNDDNPFATQLVFSNDTNTKEDGLLNVYEIYNLDLNAELAVLSACKTGVGKLNRGEGVMSLARGFFYAGVPGIVMTLWAIEDGASMEIVTGFYKNLKAGMKKDHALREAKLAYLNNADQMSSHPYFWAAYVQIGDNSKLSEGSNSTILLVLLGILICGSIIVLWLKKKR